MAMSKAPQTEAEGVVEEGSLLPGPGYWATPREEALVDAPEAAGLQAPAGAGASLPEAPPPAAGTMPGVLPSSPRPHPAGEDPGEVIVEFSRARARGVAVEGLLDTVEGLLRAAEAAGVGAPGDAQDPGGVLADFARLGSPLVAACARVAQGVWPEWRAQPERRAAVAGVPPEHAEAVAGILWSADPARGGDPGLWPVIEEMAGRGSEPHRLALEARGCDAGVPVGPVADAVARILAERAEALAPPAREARGGDVSALQDAVLGPMAAGDIVAAACGVVALRGEPEDVQRAVVAAAWGRLTLEGREWLAAGVAAAERWYEEHGTPVPVAAGWPPDGGVQGTVPGAADGAHPAGLAVMAGLSWSVRDWAGLAGVVVAVRQRPAARRAMVWPHVLVAAGVVRWSDADWAAARRVPGWEGLAEPGLDEASVAGALRVAKALWEGRAADVGIRWVNGEGSGGGEGGGIEAPAEAPGRGAAASGEANPPTRVEAPQGPAGASEGPSPSPAPPAPSAPCGVPGGPRAAPVVGRGAVAPAEAPAAAGVPLSPPPTPSARPGDSEGPPGAPAAHPAVSDPPTWPRVSVAPAPPAATLVTDPAEFRRLLAATEGAPVVGLDTETTGLDPHVDRVRTIQIATGGAAWVVDAWAVQEIAPLREWLAARARAGHRTVAHNAKFDLSMLRAALGGDPLAEVAVSDPMLWSQLLACGLRVEEGHGLAAVAQRWLGIDLPKEEQKGDWGAGDLRPEQVAYAARDAWVMVPLAGAMWHGVDGRKGIDAEGLAAVAALEDACAPVVADMEYDGIGFDLPYWTGLTEEIRAEAAAAKVEALLAITPFLPARAPVPRQQSMFDGVEEVPAALNLDSPVQVLAALREMKLPVEGTAEGVLKPYAADQPAVAALLAYKKQSKLLSAFGEALPKHVHQVTGRIHGSFHQLCANGVGRFSCSNPNLQQCPHEARFRKAFVAPEGRALVIADFSQIELRIMAKLSGDARMTEAYRNGEDLHRLTASLVSGVPLDKVTKAQRQQAKAVGFGFVYGMGANTFRGYAANSYGVTFTQQEAEMFRRRFFEAYAGVADYHRQQDWDARRARETRTLLGRCRRWLDTNMGLPELVNSPDQGCGADILKRAMVAVRPALLRTGAAMVATVHDEIVCEVPAEHAEEVVEAVRRTMEATASEILAPVPVEAEAAIGRSWADKT